MAEHLDCKPPTTGWVGFLLSQLPSQHGAGHYHLFGLFAQDYFEDKMNDREEKVPLLHSEKGR